MTNRHVLVAIIVVASAAVVGLVLYVVTLSDRDSPAASPEPTVTEPTTDVESTPTPTSAEQLTAAQMANELLAADLSRASRSMFEDNGCTPSEIDVMVTAVEKATHSEWEDMRGTRDAEGPEYFLANLAVQFCAELRRVHQEARLAETSELADSTADRLLSGDIPTKEGEELIRGYGCTTDDYADMVGALWLATEFPENAENDMEQLQQLLAEAGGHAVIATLVDTFCR